ncbi:MAG: nucleotidyltransferase domain-containing protein [Clostridiales Family XIII bacterium]|jgi:predicted nucleotidyltransferase|nr:nucleotidyltransferase domain-containing protein [Clostridiales Family XIII bacterium]
MDKRELEEKLNRYLEAVIGYMTPVTIILYGSQAKGTATNDSDIDIAIIVEKINGDILQIEADLFGLGVEIDSRIEPVLFAEGDDPSGFLKHIKSTGRVIYEKAS